MTESESKLLMESMWRLSKSVEMQAHTLGILQAEIRRLEDSLLRLNRRLQLKEDGTARYEVSNGINGRGH